MSTHGDSASRFLGHLDSIFRIEPEFHLFDSELPGVPGVTAITYRDIPEPGFITGVTYGLSLVPHDDWVLGRPELIISVESTDIAWPQAVAWLANDLRGRCPFSYGEVINFGEPVSDASAMSSFLVFAPSILERESYLGIDIGGPMPLNLAGIYPIHESENAVIDQIGLEAFWHHPTFDLFDVSRPAVEIARH